MALFLAKDRTGIQVVAEIHIDSDRVIPIKTNPFELAPTEQLTDTRLSLPLLSIHNTLLGQGNSIHNVDTDCSSPDTIDSYPTDRTSSSSPEIHQMDSTKSDPIIKKISEPTQLLVSLLPNIFVVQRYEENFEVTQPHPNLTIPYTDPLQIPVLQVETPTEYVESPGLRTRHARQLRQARHSLACEPSIASGLLLSPSLTPFETSHESRPGTQHILNFEHEQESNLNHILSESEKEKIQAQITAVKRSMITNAVLAVTFLVLLTFVFAMPRSVRQVCFEIVFSFIKAAMPIFTTIANFGTVQFVVSQYWQSIQNPAGCFE